MKSANNFRDFIPIEDITLVVKKLIELESNKTSSIFNLSSSKTVLIIDIAKTIQKRLKKYFNHSIPIIQKSNEEKNEEINYFTIKNDLIKSLGFLPNGIDKELDRLLHLCKNRYN